MSLTQTEKMGLARNFLELLALLLAELKDTPLDLARIVEDVTAKLNRAATANATQEEKKREAMASTVDANAATDDLYRSVSGYLDAVAGIVGKGTVAAKNILQLRSRIRDAEHHGPAVPVEPVTGGVK